jgi:mycothiol synthase
VTELHRRAGLDEVEIGEVRELATAAAEVDGSAPLSEHVLLHLGRGGAEATHLLARNGTGLAGVAHLDNGNDPAGGSAELAVHPDHRRAGLGTAIVRELLTTVPPGASLRLWAHGDHPGAAAIAARLGFRRSRKLWQLRLVLTGPPVVPELPPGVRIRPFRVGADEPAFLRVNNAAFARHPEQGGWGPDEVTRRESEPWFDPDGFLLAVDAADRVLGFHWTKVHPATAATPPIGEVYVLGVDPAAHGLRLGRALTLAGLRHLQERGLHTVMLYVEADNAAAVRLYEALGFTRWHTDVQYVR